MDEQTLENEIEDIDSQIVELLRRRAGRSDELSQCSARPRSQLDRVTIFPAAPPPYFAPWPPPTKAAAAKPPVLDQSPGTL